MCGAPASAESTRCDHCGARLATVACPSCFGTIFIGAKFCSHCGARADRAETAPETPLSCPRCRVEMRGVTVGGAVLVECGRCGGIWADAESFDRICADREQQAAVLGAATELSAPGPAQAAETVRYVPCPRCAKLMNRVNFAHCSKVVVDVCKTHGTWFDKDELRRIVEFIRAGGMELARSRQLEEIEDRKRALEAAQAALDQQARLGSSGTSLDDWHVGLSSAASTLAKLFGR